MSRKEHHKKEMEEFRRSQKQKQKEAAAATAGSALKTTAAAPDVTTYRTPGGITPFGLSPGLRIENSILNAKQQEKEYSGFAETFAQKALNEELLGNYPDSRYLWSQAAQMDQKSKEAGAKADFFREVAQTPAAFYSPPGSAPKPTKPTNDKTARTASSATSGTFADRETVQLQIDQLTKEKQDYIRASGGKADDSVLSWYDKQLRDLYSAKSALPMEAEREDILLQALGGNYYTGRPTLGGTAGQIGIGLLGADLPADIRDLAYDFEHRSSIPKGQIALDALALLPVVGGLKYADDAVAAAKAARQATKAATNLPDAAKQAHNLMDTGGSAAKKALDATGNVGYSKISSLETTQGLTMSRNSFAHLLVDISENGIKEPIKYVRVGDTNYVVDGHHRLHAAKKLGLGSVPTEEVTLPYKGYKTINDLFW